MGKETIIHIDHQPLQYLQSQTKLKQSKHFRWIGFLQQFHLVIKYKKRIQNKVVDMLSWLLTNASIVIQQSPLVHASYVEQYTKDEYFKEVYESLRHGYQNEELNYQINDKLLYHLGKICIPQSERVHVIIESYTSLISGHFGVGKTVAQL